MNTPFEASQEVKTLIDVLNLFVKEEDVETVDALLTKIESNVTFMRNTLENIKTVMNKK
jgi:hypothetical protein